MQHPQIAHIFEGAYNNLIYFPLQDFYGLANCLLPNLTSYRKEQYSCHHVHQSKETTGGIFFPAFEAN